MHSTARLRHRLAESLRRDGVLTDPAWLDAFRRVPRHVFVPRYFLSQPGGWTAVDRTDPVRLDHVYADRVLVTQLDGDPDAWHRARRGGRAHGNPTCSSSMPGIMAVMLDELSVQDGHNVLEIGTGTGYNAALLCERLGSSRMSTVDVDASLVRQAAERLSLCGYHPSILVGDGADGFPAKAPYDRILCTCSVAEVPIAWLEQTAPGGIVVTTLNRPIGAGLVRLNVLPGAVARGRVLARDGRFMPLRAHRLPGLPPLPGVSGLARRTSLSPEAVLRASSRFEFFAGLALPRVMPVSRGADTFVLHEDGSWAMVTTHGGRTMVTEGGPRRLRDVAEAAHQQWIGLGRPGRERFGVTVTPQRQEIRLDDPDGDHRWTLA
ncbi:methyltransferase domain-containing protein [Amycolatopsis endophytica]|uniref:Protein-L-isoaspartate O-methyltransferase n=1 Tax=Amycolatopsis endophytica TaxID=860233 RepID=A0A853AZL3_9PSEU|nr:methyltransferase domain-containing protein [Amycolatopsis endophytica]NYI88055.1 methyltransferase of ATP-grasp peptide maturase system [Amycolatopsis endophytica]